MIEKLQAQDFQCFERLSIDLDPKITAITGPSDVGKSAALRAFRWVATNRPRGDGFVRKGCKGTRVRLRVDGVDVERRRKGALNEYRIDGKVFKAFGADVPEEVVRLLNVGPENFGGQHDPAFWFCLTPGEVAKELNAIVDLGVIDEVTARIAARLRKARAEVEVTEGRWAEAKGERELLEFVPAMVDGLEAVEKLAGERDRTRAEEGRLRALVENGLEHGRRARRLSGAALGGAKVVSAGAEAVEARKGADSLRKLIKEAWDATDEAGMEVPGLCGLEALLDEAKRRRREAEGIGDLAADARRSDHLLVRSQDGLEAARVTLEDETEGLCPLCGGPLAV